MRIITPQGHHHQQPQGPPPPRPPLVMPLGQPPPVSLGLNNMTPIMGPPSGGLPLVGGQHLAAQVMPQPSSEEHLPAQQTAQQQQPHHMPHAYAHHHHHHPPPQHPAPHHPGPRHALTAPQSAGAPPHHPHHQPQPTPSTGQYHGAQPTHGNPYQFGSVNTSSTQQTVLSGPVPPHHPLHGGSYSSSGGPSTQSSQRYPPHHHSQYQPHPQQQHPMPEHHQYQPHHNYHQQQPSYGQHLMPASYGSSRNNNNSNNINAVETKSAQGFATRHMHGNNNIATVVTPGNNNNNSVRNFTHSAANICSPGPAIQYSSNNNNINASGDSSMTSCSANSSSVIAHQTHHNYSAGQQPNVMPSLQYPPHQNSTTYNQYQQFSQMPAIDPGVYNSECPVNSFNAADGAGLISQQSSQQWTGMPSSNIGSTGAVEASIYARNSRPHQMMPQSAATSESKFILTNTSNSLPSGSVVGGGDSLVERNIPINHLNISAANFSTHSSSVTDNSMGSTPANTRSGPAVTLASSVSSQQNSTSKISSLTVAKNLPQSDASGSKNVSNISSSNKENDVDPATQNVPEELHSKDDDSNTSPSDDKSSSKEKTPMCLVNELARYNKIQHQYCLTDEKGPAHKKCFTVTLRLGPEEQYSASGASIKRAQHSAAEVALNDTKYKHPPPKPVKLARQSKLTPTVELNALAMKRGEAAVYTLLDNLPQPSSSSPPPGVNFTPAFAASPFHPVGARLPPHLLPPPPNMPPNLRAVYHQKFYGRLPMYPIFLVSLRIGGREFIGEGNTAQQAKHNAAAKALRVVKSLPLPQETTGVTSSASDKDGSSELESSDLKSPVSMVHEVALRRSMSVRFEVIGESGPPHMRNFITACVVGDTRCHGEGASKKVSKKKSAEMMLEELRKLPAIPAPSPAKTKKKVLPKKKSRNLVKEQDTPDYGQGVNPISRLIQIQQGKKEKEPVYALVAERGAPRRREFVMQVELGQLSSQGTGPNKKLAKRAAAENMLLLLGYSKPSPQPSKSAIKSTAAQNDSNSSVESSASGNKSARKVTFKNDEKQSEVASDQNDNYADSPIFCDNSSVDTNSRREENTSYSAANSDEVQSVDAVSSSQATAAHSTDSNPTTSGVVEVKCVESPPASSLSGGVRPSDKLEYLAHILGLELQYTDFPKGNKSQYLSLVSLNTSPPHVSHGSAATVAEARDQASMAALRSLAEMGLDNVVSN